MRFTIAAFASLTLLSACDSGTSDTSQTADTNTVETAAALDANPAPVLAEDLIIDENSPTMEFEWSVPPIVARYPALLDTLHKTAEANRTELAETAREQAQFRAEEKLPPLAVTHEQKWQVAFRNAALINLTANTYIYTGGAHPNSFFLSTYWDKEDKRAVKIADLFISWPEVRGALSTRYCKALNEMRRERRGQMTAPAQFDECPALEEQPIALRGPKGGAPFGVTILLSPYVAGSYAEGAYEVPVDFDETLQAAIKARYRGRG